MELETLQDLYIHELKDLYSAEKQLVQALPKMAKAAHNEELSAGIQEHLNQTKEHAARLEKILSSHKQSTRGPKCKGMARTPSCLRATTVEARAGETLLNERAPILLCRAKNFMPLKRKESLREGLQRISERRLQDVLQMIAREGPTAESVHKARKIVKSLRATCD
jgi:hypothetical protein